MAVQADLPRSPRLYCEMALCSRAGKGGGEALAAVEVVVVLLLLLAAGSLGSGAAAALGGAVAASPLEAGSLGSWAAAALGRHLPQQQQHLPDSSSSSSPGGCAALAALPARLHPSALGVGARVEVKNLNSIRAVGKCVEGEALRQAEILEAGGVVVSETRSYTAAGSSGSASASGGATLREKAGAADYRFLPEADIEPLLVPAAVLLIALGQQRHQRVLWG
jgi:hypothetical protein